MPSTQITSNQYFRNLNIIFYALIAGLVLFILVTYFLREFSDYQSGQPIDVFYILVPIFGIGSIIASIVAYKLRLKIANSKHVFESKMAAYTSACIISYAIVEGASLFSIVVYLINGNNLVLLMPAALILYLFTIKPSREKTIRDLNLSPHEINRINNPNEVISVYDYTDNKRKPV